MLSVNSYLDHRNYDLWNDLNRKFSITLSYHSEGCYGFYKINDKVTIYVPYREPCISSFSHELLHLWMDMKDVSVSCTLSSTFKMDPLLSVIFPSKLADHLGNCSDHYKMLPLYLQMGFERGLFIEDYYTSKCTNKEIALIELWYEDADFTKKCYVTEQYLAKFFAIKACPNPSFNYDKELLRLKKTDSTLFDILDSFWLQLQGFDITNSDPVFNSYRLFTYPFTTDLKKRLATRFCAE